MYIAGLNPIPADSKGIPITMNKTLRKTYLDQRRASLSILNEIVSGVQLVYDEWDQDWDEYGGGGICQDIAVAISYILGRHSIENSVVSQTIEDIHVYVVAKLKDGIYRVDISPYIYEAGFGYSWKKIPGVVFTVEDITVELIDENIDNFCMYIE